MPGCKSFQDIFEILCDVYNSFKKAMLSLKPHGPYQVWQSLCTVIGMTANLSSRYHPHSNGQAEHTNQTLKNTLSVRDRQLLHGVELLAACSRICPHLSGVSSLWSVAFHGVVGLSTAPFQPPVGEAGCSLCVNPHLGGMAVPCGLGGVERLWELLWAFHCDHPDKDQEALIREGGWGTVSDHWC